MNAPPDRPASQRTVDLLRRTRWLGWAAVLAVYALSWNGVWRAGDDSGAAMVLARHVGQGHGWAHPDGLHGELSPGFVAASAVMFWVFPENDLTAVAGVTALSFALGLLGLVLAYRLVRLREGPGLAMGVVLTLAATELWHQHALAALPDVWFACSAMAALLGYERWRRVGKPGGRAPGPLLLLIIGVVGMLATRSVGVVFVAALVLTELVRAARAGRRRPVWIGAMAACALLAVGHAMLVAPAPPWTLHVDQRLVIDKLTKHLPQTLDQVARHNVPHLLIEAAPEAVFGMDLGHAGALGGLAAVGLGLSLFRFRLLWGVWFALLLVQWVVLLPTDRYLLPVLPLLVLAWWRACIDANRFVSAKLAGRSVHLRRASGVGFVLLLMLLYVPNALRTVRTVGVQRSPAFYERYRDGKYLPWIEVSAWLREHTGESESAVTPDDAPHGAVALWSDRRAGSTAWPGLQGVASHLIEARPEPDGPTVRLHGWRRGAWVFTTEAVDRKARPVVVRRAVWASPKADRP